MTVRLLLIAKEPVPGRVKTRLSPPCSPEQAASLARAAIEDTLDVMVATGVPTTVVLDGRPDGLVPPGIDVIPQRQGGLDERLAGAFEDAGTPAVLIGMDTPQVTSALLCQGVDELDQPGIDAVYGPSADGGFWLIGLSELRGEVFRGVPMSEPTTGSSQLDRLDSLGYQIAHLPELRDVDNFDDAREAAGQAPNGRFAAAVSRSERQMA